METEGFTTAFDAYTLQFFLYYLIAQITAFLVGSIPFGYVIAKAKSGIDIREHGSGNIGATNVGRVLGFRFFLVVFLLDFLKGALPVAAAVWLRNSHQDPKATLFEQYLFLPELVGFACILGHMFPVFLSFRGGKGVATSIGVILVLAPYSCITGLMGFLVFLLVTRMVSMGSIGFALAFGISHFVAPWSQSPLSLRNSALTTFVVLISLLIIVRHRSNLGRVIRGTEPQISFRRKKPAAP